LVDLTYAVVKASAKKGKLLTDQNFVEVAGARDLRDFAGRVKERYPNLGAMIDPSLREIEDQLRGNFTAEVDEFSKAAPELSQLFELLKRELEEVRAVSLVKWQLGLIPWSAEMGPKEPGRGEERSIANSRDFAQEADNAKMVFQRYGVPGLIEVVFERGRILKMLGAVSRLRGGAAEGLRNYMRLKVDFFNAIVILRGIRNGVDRKALEEITIPEGGSLSRAALRDMLKAADVAAGLGCLASSGVFKAASLRELERGYGERLSRIATRTYYGGYIDIGAIVGYLELKLREIRILIRIANAIARGIDPKRVAQDLVY